METAGSKDGDLIPFPKKIKALATCPDGEKREYEFLSGILVKKLSNGSEIVGAVFGWCHHTFEVRF